MKIPEGHKFILAGGWALPPLDIAQPELIRISQGRKAEPDKVWLDLPTDMANPKAIPVTVNSTMVGTIDELVQAFKDRLTKAAYEFYNQSVATGLCEERRQQVQEVLKTKPVVLSLCKSNPFWRAYDGKRK